MKLLDVFKERAPISEVVDAIGNDLRPDYIAVRKNAEAQIAKWAKK